jgi:S1-C subfamily serine protease
MKPALALALTLLAAFAARSAPAEDAARAANPGALFFVGPAHPPQGYLGVDVRDVTADQLTVLKLREARGAEIILVDHDAPAGKAGLREHDVVLQMNGQPIAGEDQIRRMLRESPPGKTITLLISRDGQQITISTQMAVSQEEVERQAWEQHLTVPEPQAPPADPASDLSAGAASPVPTVHGNSFIGTMLMNPSYTGAMLEKMSSQLAAYFGVPGSSGLLVRSVQQNSPADHAGMHAGDVVVSADSHPIATPNDWTKAIKNSHGHPLTIVVLRDKKEQTLTLTPDSKKRSSLAFPDSASPDPASPDSPGSGSPTADVARLGLSLLPRS